MAEVAVLALSEGVGIEAVLEQVLVGGEPTFRLLVEVADSPERRQWLADLLLDRSDLGIVGSEHLRTGVAIYLGRADGRAVTGAAAAVLLNAIRPAERSAPALWPATKAVPTKDKTPARSIPVRAKAVPAPPVRRKLGRRAKAVLAGSGLATALLAAALVAVGQSSLGAHGMLVAMVLMIALLQAGSILGVAYLVRIARGERVASRGFREALEQRIERMGKQNKKLKSTLAVLSRSVGRQRAHHEYVVELGRQLTRQGQQAESAAKRRHLMTERQTQALLNLRDLVEVRSAVPPMGGWAASPDLLAYCVDALVRRKPTLIVECGSGTSTLYLALAAEQHGLDTKIVSLEHQASFADATRAMLERHGVAHRVEVRLAPLEPSSVPGHPTPWYAESAVVDLRDIGMLLVDGPPTATGLQARYPAVPVLVDRLAPNCLIVMDDLIREADHQTAKAWADLLPDFDLSVIREFDKHVGILRRG